MGLMGMAGSAARAIGPILGGFFYASVLALTDSPIQAALIPVTIAILASIVGTVAVLPLMIKSRKSSTASVNGKPFEEE